MGKDTSIKQQCSDTIEHIHDLFENLPDVASIEIDDYVSELAILHHQEDTSTIAVKESEKLRKKLIRYYMQLSEVRRLLAETKLYYESEDKLWLTEINMLAGECNRAHEKAILIHRNNVHDGLKLAVKLASTRLPEAPLSRDEIDVLLDEVKAALKI
ncbi:hypothetical protein HDE_07255 [Halotydeus destructor]|nr:hypothetical protein HDE_07255 [Halotydeus destructor]